MSNKLIKKIGCKCGSSDARAIYDDGSEYCYSCKDFKKATDNNTKPTNNSNNTVQQSNNFETLLKGTSRNIESRKLNKDTCDFYQYHIGSYKGETVQIANYCDSFGNVKGQKIRTKNKEFRFIGSKKETGLFGQNLFPSGGDKIIITEGEVDCLSIYQAMRGTTPVVSIPTGATGAKKELQKEFEYVDSFKEVIFAFDSDDAGREAVEECSSLFLGKIKVVNYPLGFKDANDMLLKGNISDLLKSIKNSKDYRPDTIAFGHESLDVIMEEEVFDGYSIPYSKLNHKIEGLRKGEIVTITSGSGMGKSTFTTELAYHLLTHHNLKIGMIALEERENKTMRNMVALDLNTPERRLSEVSADDKKKAFENTIGKEGQFVVYRHKGTFDVDSIMAQIRYITLALGVDFVIFDHLSMAVSGMDTDERKALDMAMSELRKVVEKTGVGILLVVHTKRPSTGVGFENGGELSLSSLRGTGGIGQISDIVIGLERDQQSDNETGNETQIRILKNRYTGITGVAGKAMYVQGSGRFISWDEDDLPDNPFDDERQGPKPKIKDDNNLFSDNYKDTTEEDETPF